MKRDKKLLLQNLILFFVTFSSIGRPVGESEEEAVGPQDHRRLVGVAGELESTGQEGKETSKILKIPT